jgi:hypothetical protein
MNRRAFFASLLGTAAAAAIDPERLLWTPGARLISIPPALDGRPCLTFPVIEQFIHQVSNEIRQNKPAPLVRPVDDAGEGRHCALVCIALCADLRPRLVSAHHRLRV